MNQMDPYPFIAKDPLLLTTKNNLYSNIKKEYSHI